MEVDGFVTVLYAGLTYHGDPAKGARRGTSSSKVGDHPTGYYAAQRFIDNHRRPEGKNTLSREFLESVAKVYRAHHKSGAPTKAVAKTFGVKDRMASNYVDRARQRTSKRANGEGTVAKRARGGWEAKLT